MGAFDQGRNSMKRMIGYMRPYLLFAILAPSFKQSQIKILKRILRIFSIECDFLKK